jgi:hypothetical protein
MQLSGIQLVYHHMRESIDAHLTIVFASRHSERTAAQKHQVPASLVAR